MIVARNLRSPQRNLPSPRAERGRGRGSFGTSVAFATVAAVALTLLMPGVLHAQGADRYRLTGEFKLIDVTTRAREGDLGFAHEGDDTRQTNLLSLRLMGEARPFQRLSLEAHYLNQKLDSDTGLPTPGTTGAELFRYEPLRWDLEEPRTDADHPTSAQTVTWTHELDRAQVRWEGSTWAATVGRQPITFGAGRFWQPTDVFGAFGPTELETEFKPGVDALRLNVFPSAFSELSGVMVFSPRDEPDVEDSGALHARFAFGEASEASALAGSVRGRDVAGGSLETAWLEAGWRIEAVSMQLEPEESERFTFAIAGVDRQFADGPLVALELYHHSEGATRSEELTAVALSELYQQGFQKQLSRNVAGLALQHDLTGLLNGSYTLFAASLEDTGTSLLHQLTLTYSIADEADAVFAGFHGTGKGLDGFGRPRSEFGAVPDTLYVRLRFYF